MEKLPSIVKIHIKEGQYISGKVLSANIARDSNTSNSSNTNFNLFYRGDEEYALRRRRSRSCQREKPLSREETRESFKRADQERAATVRDSVLQEETEEAVKDLSGRNEDNINNEDRIFVI